MTSSTVGKDGRAALVTKQSSGVAEGAGTELGRQMSPQDIEAMRCHYRKYPLPVTFEKVKP